MFAHMSVFDNLCLGAYRKDARADYRDELERVYTLFPRLRERSTQLAGRLSGGEQQMLAVGRALMSRPRLLVMDEPSLGLAPVVVDEVFEVIESITSAGVSVLLVEQEVERALAVSSRATSSSRAASSPPAPPRRCGEAPSCAAASSACERGGPALAPAALEPRMVRPHGSWVWSQLNRLVSIAEPLRPTSLRSRDLANCPRSGSVPKAGEACPVTT